MIDIFFEWDDVKAASNLKKHSVSFEAARTAFQDAFAIIEIDDAMDYGEERLVLTGITASVNGTILVVVYTERAERIRIISARKASKREQHGYYHHQTPE